MMDVCRCCAQLVAGFCFVLISACSLVETPAPSACDNITCSSHGNCVVLQDQPTCACDEGFVADSVNGLSCVSTGAPGADAGVAIDAGAASDSGPAVDTGASSDSGPAGSDSGPASGDGGAVGSDAGPQADAGGGQDQRMRQSVRRRHRHDQALDARRFGGQGGHQHR